MSNEAISSIARHQPSLPVSWGTSAVDEIAGRMMPTYGDYFGLVTTPDGRFRAVWPEMRDGHSVLLTAIVEVEGHATQRPGR